MYIYLITNLVNNKKYVGQTSDYQRRMTQHKTQKDQLIDKKIQQYGIQNFSFQIIEQDLSPEEVDEKEKKHLKALGFDSLPSIIELSQRYRTLCRKFHPDTISSLGLDQEYIEFASKRFQEIHEAYIYLLDRIKK